jgi:hypothetical protein
MKSSLLSRGQSFDESKTSHFHITSLISILNSLMIFSIFDNSAWNIPSSGIDRNMQSMSLFVCCHGDFNGLTIFKVKGQCHGETDDNLAWQIETCQVQYVCMGSWEFQRASQFLGQRSRSWWNWYLISSNISTSGRDRTMNSSNTYVWVHNHGYSNVIMSKWEGVNGKGRAGMPQILPWELSKPLVFIWNHKIRHFRGLFLNVPTPWNS